MLSKDELNKIDELGSQEIQRLHDLILAQTLKNKGECVGFIDSTILSDNLLVNNLINIRRMDTPYEFEDDFIEHCQNEGYNIENKWPAKAMFDSDLSANKAALELGFISGWYDFCNYETKLKGLDYNLVKALAEIELDGVVACTDHNHMVLNMLGLSDEMLNKFYHNGYKTLYDLPNFDNILPSDEADWSEDDIAFYQNYEPLVNSMSEKEFNKCCDLLNDETIPCVYSDAIKEALGIKSDNAWKFDPLMNSMYGYGEEYKQDYINSMNNPETQGRDGLLESHEKEVDMEYMDDNLLAKHNKLAEEIGVDEYNKTLWFMEQNDLTIDDVLDEKGNYKADLVSNYFKSHEEPTNDQWLKYLEVLGDNVSGFAEWLKDINKSKDGKDREFTNFKNRSMGK